MTARRPFACGSTLSGIWAPVALAGAAAAAGAAHGLRGREPADIVLTAVFGAILLVLAWTDVRRMVIPNRVVYPALALALGVSPAWTGRGPAAALAGAIGALVVLALVRRLSRGGLGGGDVKLAALVGAVVGYPGVLLAGLVTATAGGAVAAALVVAGRAGRGTRIPYGPLLSLGAMTELLR